MNALSQQQRTDCLKLNPFDGDFGAPGDRIFSDRISVARSAGVCHCCSGVIEPGEEQRRHVGKYDDDMRTFRWCSRCCAAMSLSWTDNGVELERRFGLRREQVAA